MFWFAQTEINVGRDLVEIIGGIDRDLVGIIDGVGKNLVGLVGN